MLTSNDRRAREILIQTHTLFQKRKRWTRSQYHSRRGLIRHRDSYCLVGGVSLNLGCKFVDNKGNQTLFLSKEDTKFFWEIWELFRKWVESPTEFNDTHSRKDVLTLLKRAINALEEEIAKDADWQWPTTSSERQLTSQVA